MGSPQLNGTSRFRHDLLVIQLCFMWSVISSYLLYVTSVEEWDMVAASVCKLFTVLYHIIYILICNIRMYCLHLFTYKDCTHKKAFIREPFV